MAVRNCANWERLSAERHMIIQCQAETVMFRKVKRVRHTISCRKQVVTILNYLYKDSTENTRLNRKYLSYLNCLEWAHRH